MSGDREFAYYAVTSEWSAVADSAKPAKKIRKKKGLKSIISMKAGGVFCSENRKLHSVGLKTETIKELNNLQTRLRLRLRKENKQQ